MIITLDGPAGTGKSTVARAVAERLGFDLLDTGAMYRAVGLAAIERGIDLTDTDRLAAVAAEVTIDFDWSQRPPEVTLDGRRLGDLIRTPEATHASSVVATVPEVRALLVAHQRRIGWQRPNLVTEGRDQGTIVFPDARLKFYLDASPEERTRRRVNQLHQQGKPADYQQTLDQIRARDLRDSTRVVGPLAVPEGADVIDTTRLTQQEVAEFIISRAQAAAQEP